MAVSGTRAFSPYPEKPNVLVLLVDEQRYPPVYENPEIRQWRRRHFAAQQFLRTHGVEFHNHYIGSAACCPSRATLFTGHYPSLHGVSQTNGIAKEAFDSDMFWLDRNTVPTMGDYFRAAGYRTFYKGKWHMSDEDIIVPGTHAGLPSYDRLTGVPDANQELYRNAERLDDFGFSGWIGPEPHGKNPRNSASSASVGLSGRDEVYGAEVVRLIESLDRERASGKEDRPWLIVASFVNPHDIVLYGDRTARSPAFRFEVDPDVPEVDPPPTLHETLKTKPRCQASYRNVYPKALQPITDRSFYRRLYYQLQKNADRQMENVLQSLLRSSFRDNTVVVFTSDHGDLLGAHGDLHQKWYCAYEEMLHVPLILYSPRLFPEHRDVRALTSHVDLLPTLLGLAGADIEKLRASLLGRFSEARPFAGRNLAPYLTGPIGSLIADEPIYYMSDDDVTRGQHQISPFGVPYSSVVQPNHVETVVATIRHNGALQLWKLSRYFDHPRFWSEPGVRDVTANPAANHLDGSVSGWTASVKTEPVEDEFELYNLTEDPLEIRNLANTPESGAVASIRQRMLELLAEERKQKRLSPQQSAVP